MVLSEGKTGHVGGCCTALITYVIQRCTLQTWKNKKIKKLRRWEGGYVWHDSMIFFCSATALDPSPKGFENPHPLPNYKNPLFLFLPLCFLFCYMRTLMNLSTWFAPGKDHCPISHEILAREKWTFSWMHSWGRCWVGDCFGYFSAVVSLACMDMQLSLRT